MSSITLLGRGFPRSTPSGRTAGGFARRPRSNRPTRGAGRAIAAVGRVVEALEGRLLLSHSPVHLTPAASAGNSEPVFDQIPDIIETFPGQPLSFTVQASDFNAGDTVTIDPINLPDGLTLTPTDPAPGSAPNAVALLAQWTPTADQAGQATLIDFEAVDSHGATADGFVLLGPFPQPSQDMVDPTFNGDGGVSFDFSAEAVATQDDGKLLVAGVLPYDSFKDNEAVLERLNPDGSLDSTFGDGGVVIDGQDIDESYYGVTVQPDGKIVTTGTSDGLFLIARYNPDGTPDAGFGDGGRVTADLSDSGTNTAVGYSVAYNPSNGGVVVGGGSNGDFVIASFAADGSYDPVFNDGSPRIVQTGDNAEVLSQVAVQPDGKIVGAGADGPYVFLARFNPDGTLDPTFNPTDTTNGVQFADGLTTNPLPDGSGDPTEGLALDAAGRILVCNTTADGNFGLVRLNPDGTPDLSFGNNGLVTTDFGGPSDADLVALSPDGSDIFVAGTTTQGGVDEVAIAAYNPDGSPDTTFGNNGVEVYADAGVSDASASAAVARPAATAGGTVAHPFAVGIGQIVSRLFGAVDRNGNLLIGDGSATKSRTVSSLRRLKVNGPSSPTPTPSPTPSPSPSPTPSPSPSPTPSPTPSPSPSPTPSPSPSPAPTPTPPLTDAEKVQADLDQLAADKQNNSNTQSADKATLAAVTANDKQLIAADKARIRGDRGNADAKAGDLAQLRADQQQMRLDVAAAKAKLARDKAAGAVELKTDNAQLRADKLQLKRDHAG